MIPAACAAGMESSALNFSSGKLGIAVHAILHAVSNAVMLLRFRRDRAYMLFVRESFFLHIDHSTTVHTGSYDLDRFFKAVCLLTIGVILSPCMLANRKQVGFRSGFHGF